MFQPITYMHTYVPAYTKARDDVMHISEGFKFVPIICIGNLSKMFQRSILSGASFKIYLCPEITYYLHTQW